MGGQSASDTCHSGSQENPGGKGGQENSISCLGRSSSELRPGCSSLHPVRIWKLSRIEQEQPPRATHSPAQLYKYKRVSLSPDRISHSFISSHHTLLGRARLQLLGIFLSSVEGCWCWWAHIQTISTPSWISQAPAGSPQRASAPATNSLGIICSTSFPVLECSISKGLHFCLIWICLLINSHSKSPLEFQIYLDKNILNISGWQSTQYCIITINNYS